MKCGNVFVLGNSALGLVEKEALHQWAESQMGFPLPYDQLQRICSQLAEQPQQQKWTLQVGRGWNIVRNGTALTAVREGMEDDKEQGTVERVLAWSLVESDDEPEASEDTLLIQLSDIFDPTDADCSFVLSDASHTKKVGFTPPWRENPIELHDFLRGQKVPLHRRGCAPVVYLNRRDGPSLVAVFIEQEDGHDRFAEKRGKWIVDAIFNVATEEAGQRVRLDLQLSD